MIRLTSFALLALVPLAVRAADDALTLFRKANVAVDTIYSARTVPIGSGYTVEAIYGYPGGTAFEGHFVGVFLLRNGTLVEVMDMVPSERRFDFLPVIRVANRSRVVVGFVSDYGELDKRKYVLNLRGDPKLVRVVKLPVEGYLH